MMAAVQVAVRQTFDKGIAAGQLGQQGGGIRPPGDSLGHLDGKLIGQAQHGQKLLLHRRQRIDHGGGEQVVDVGAFVRQGAAVLQRLQAQVDGGEPALGSEQQLFHVRVGKLAPAAADISAQPGFVQPQLLGAENAHPAAQLHQLVFPRMAVAGGDDDMHVLRQAQCPLYQKNSAAGILQQMEVIKEDIAGIRPGQCVVQIVDQHGGCGGILGAVVALQHIVPGAVKGVLHALPKDGQAV